MRYAFVGLGNLGSRLARHLLDAGYEVVVHDVRSVAATALTEHGAVWAPAPEAAAAEVDGFITCLPSPEASQTTVTAALQTLRPGSTWLEMSTTDPPTLQALAATASRQGVDVLECPVTGGLHRAARGEMTCFVGGATEVFERHRPALRAMCGPLFHIGELGSASLLKVITNMLCLIDLVAAGEALMLARRAGLDLARCYDAICASSGSSREFEDWVPVILNGSLDTGFTLDLALKDLDIGLEQARTLEVPVTLTREVRELMAQARGRFGGSAWTPHVIRMLEELTGTTLRAEGFDDVIGSQR